MKHLRFAAALVAIVVLVSGCTDNGGNGPKSGKWMDLGGFEHILKSSTDFYFKEIDDMSGASGYNASETVIFLIGMDSGFQGEDADLLIDFINAGGNVVIAAENSYPQPVAAAFGLKYYGHRVISENYDKNISFVRAVSTLWGNYSLLLYEPTGIVISTRADTLSYTYIVNISTGENQIAGVDYNDNGILDGDEWPDEVPVSTGVEVSVSGGGRCLFLGDTGIFTDDLNDRYDNRAFVNAMIGNMTAGRMNVLYHTGYQNRGYSAHLLYGEEE